MEPKLWNIVFTPDDLDPYWRDVYEERAAIMQYDGGLSQNEAERLALEDVKKQIARSK